VSIGTIVVPYSSSPVGIMSHMAKYLNLQTLSSFMGWLDMHLQRLGWTDNQLAKKAGISHSVISKARKQTQSVGWDACVGIAGALDLPPEVVLRQAGHLPTPPDRDDEAEELLHLFQQLPQDKKTDLLNIARMYREGSSNNSKR
jgi:transcriptional regulator with XRE-family HTH domain